MNMNMSDTDEERVISLKAALRVKRKNTCVETTFENDQVVALSISNGILSEENYFSRILSKIAQLTNLKTLNLSDNNITSLNALEELTHLEQLESLCVNNNHIEVKAALNNLSRLKKLKSIEIKGNPIDKKFLMELKKTLPDVDIILEDDSVVIEEIKNEFGYQTIKATRDIDTEEITTISLANNNISSIDINLVYKLMRLKKLVVLDLSNNKLGDIDLLQKLTRLNGINLKNNTSEGKDKVLYENGLWNLKEKFPQLVVATYSDKK